jgi:phage terminase large subunit-like protein
MPKSNTEARIWKVLQRSAYNADGSLWFPKILTEAWLNAQRKTLGPYLFACNPGDAPVLMADWSSRPIHEIQPGDEVVGWAAETNRYRLVRSRVLRIFVRQAMTARIVVGDRVIRCTPDHQFYQGRKRAKRGGEYQPPKIGRKLWFVGEPVFPPPSDADIALWLGGMFDGEGSCANGICISQSRSRNSDVCEAIGHRLRRLGFTYREYAPCARQFRISGGREAMRRFLQWCRPVRARKIIEYLYKRGGWLALRQDKITQITPHKRETVYALETTTGNYVVWGYASSNSQYLNQAIAREEQRFLPEWIVRRDMFLEASEGRLHVWAGNKLIPVNVFTAVDPALSSRETADFTGIVSIAVDPLGTWYVLSARRFRGAAHVVIEEVIKEIKQWHTGVLGVEVIAFQAALKDFLLVRLAELNIRVQLVELKTGSGRGKRSRIEGLVPLFAGGRVYIREGVGSELEEELLMWSPVKETGHDDVIDALSHLSSFSFPASVEGQKDLGFQWADLPPKERERLRRAKGQDLEEGLTGNSRLALRTGWEGKNRTAKDEIEHKLNEEIKKELALIEGRRPFSTG